MKNQNSSVTDDIAVARCRETQNKPPDSFDISNSKNEDDKSDLDSGYIKSSTSSIDINELPPWKLKIPKKQSSEHSEEDFAKILSFYYQNIDNIPETEKYNWLKNRFTEDFGRLLTKPIIDISVAQFFEGDTGISMDIKPDWLDKEKFVRGQKFAQEYMFGIYYAELLSLFTVFSFQHGLSILISTGASNTPYDAFKRYLSTATRVRNWYTSDPWTEGTPAYNDIKTVRQMHAIVRQNLSTMSPEDYANITKIQNPMCPTLSISQRDFESSCPAAKFGQCYYKIVDKYPEIKRLKINQADMACTQFAFVGLTVVYPEFFGIHVSEEELEDFCHMWRGIGYLLGMDDRFNFCRGTLEDVRERSRDFLDCWVKPNFREITPECEHMLRCVIEGMQFYFPGSTYECCLLDLATILRIHMPRLYESLSYIQWIRHGIIRFYFDYGSRLPRLRAIMTRGLNRCIDRAHKFDEDKHKELQERSTKTLESRTTKMQKSNEIRQE